MKHRGLLIKVVENKNGHAKENNKKIYRIAIPDIKENGRYVGNC